MLSVRSLKTVAYGMRDFVKDLLQSPHWPQRPQHLMFEVTGACDAACIHCPREAMDRPKRQMPFELYRRMIDQAAEMRIPDLFPNGYGEMLLIRNLGDYFAYARSKAHRFRIMCNTNGYRLTDDKIDAILKHRVDLLNITIDGATAETAQAVRVGLETPVIEDNIFRLLSRRKALGLRVPKIRVGMVLIKQNAHEGEAFLRKWQGIVDYVGLAGFSTRAGSSGLAAQPDVGTTEKHPCVLPFQDLNIWSDGKAVLCCEDWNEEHVVGDLNTQTLPQI
jgi:hypothetical protein